MTSPTQDRDDELLGLDQLIAEGIPAAAAHTILRGTSCVTWQEASDRWEMLQREREGRP